MGMEYRAVSAPARMVVISDGDVAANFVRDAAQKQWLPLGYNHLENVTYSNKDLMLNTIEYLIDPTGVIEARTKEVKLRLLDTVRMKEQANLWRGLNLGLPIVLLGIFGWFFNWRRKRKYAK